MARRTVDMSWAQSTIEGMLRQSSGIAFCLTHVRPSVMTTI